MIFTRLLEIEVFCEQELKIANVVIERKISVRFFGVFFGEKTATRKTKMARYSVFRNNL